MSGWIEDQPQTEDEQLINPEPIADEIEGNE
jgi:hypothetical protein